MKLIFLYFLVCFVITSCEIINPAEQVPSYIKIDKIEINETSGLYGSLSSKISDAWINVDGNIIGIFELPVTIPVLAIGKHQILVRAGIKPNGISAKRKIYPFYDTCLVNTELVQNTIVTLTPKVKYRKESIMALNENFEENGFFFDSIKGSDAALTKVSSTDKRYEGSYSGAIILPAGKNIFQCKSSSSFAIPFNNQPIYLEFNYKNNVEFQIGIIVNSATRSDLYQTFYHVNPSKEWNKVYFELTDMVYTNIAYSSFNVFIGVDKKNSTEDGEIYLDNIKLFHF